MSDGMSARSEGRDDQQVASLVERVAHLEALLANQSQSVDPTSDRSPETPMANGDRKPKGGPLPDATRQRLVAKRERLELARMAEQAAWDDLKAEIHSAAEAGVSYREIGDAIGVTRARVYQIVSGKR